MMTPNRPSCGACQHWREQPRPADPRTGAVALDPSAPRLGNCFRGPPQIAPGLTPEGMTISLIYPPLVEAFPSCDQFAARAPLNGTADPDMVVAWWDDRLHTLIGASARGETFLADCVMGELDQRLRQAEQTERAVILRSMLAMVQTVDKLYATGAGRDEGEAT